MADERKSHRDTLKQLYEDFNHVEPDNHATREVLAGAMQNLERAINDEHGEGIMDQQTLVEQLNDAALNLETDHPALAAAIRTAINILTNLGL